MEIEVCLATLAPIDKVYCAIALPLAVILVVVAVIIVVPLFLLWFVAIRLKLLTRAFWNRVIFVFELMQDVRVGIRYLHFAR